MARIKASAVLLYVAGGGRPSYVEPMGRVWRFSAVWGLDVLIVCAAVASAVGTVARPRRGSAEWLAAVARARRWLPHRYRVGALNDHQEQRQETRTAQRHACLPEPFRLRRQGPDVVVEPDPKVVQRVIDASLDSANLRLRAPVVHRPRGAYHVIVTTSGSA